MPKNGIHKLKDGRYCYQVLDAAGFPLKINSRKGESKRDFSLRCDDLDRKALQEVRSETLDSLFEAWLTDYVKVKLSPSEVRDLPPVYAKHIKPYIGKMLITDINQNDVYKVLARADKKGLSTNYIRKIRACISRPYTWAINQLGYKVVSPTTNLSTRGHLKRLSRPTVSSLIKI